MTERMINMKKRLLAISAALLLCFSGCTFNININNSGSSDESSQTPSEAPSVSSAVTASTVTVSEPIVSQQTPQDNLPARRSTDPFYGIWVGASKELNDCEAIVSELNGKGYSATVHDTVSWSNLNSEHWYVVTAGEYSTEDAANAALENVKSAGYPDAYVKYTGSWVEEPSSQPESASQAAQTTQPFYGIWVGASQSMDDCEAIVTDLTEKGFYCSIQDTANWSGLNTEHWYVVTAGEYPSEELANRYLKNVQEAGYPDAYIKYTGDWVNVTNGHQGT